MRTVLILAFLAMKVAAQQPVVAPPNPEISLLQARNDLDLADSAYSRTLHLFEREMVSAAELELRRAERERAMLTVLEHWMALTASAPRLRVVHAYKARSSDGSAVARIRIALIASEIPTLLPDDHLTKELLDRLGSASATQAFVSLKDEVGAAGTAVAVPYERGVAMTPDADVHDLEFRLLRDIDAAVISLAWNGRIDERKVWLEADVSGIVRVQPLPFSQEGDVGTDVFYDLTIERFGGGDAPVRLSVRGLPTAIAHSFTDAETGVRINQLRFSAAEHQRRVRLGLTLPTPDADAIAVDSAYHFTIVAAPDPVAGDARAASVRSRSGAGTAELEVVPRGVGRAELRVVNLYHEIADGDPAIVGVMVRNSGSRTLERARVEIEAPPGWRVGTEPPVLQTVAPGQELPVRLTIAAAAGADFGDYEVRVRVQATSGRTRSITDPTVLRVRVQARSGSLAVGALLGLLLVAAAATVILTRRLARR